MMDCMPPQPSYLKRILASVLLMAACAPWEPALAQPRGPMMFSVEGAPAEGKSITTSLQFTGTVDPWRVIELSSQVDGLVSEIPIEEGQTLDEGDLVCRLDTEPVDIQIRRQQAMLDNAKADSDRLAAGYRSEEIDEARRKADADQARFQRAKDDWERKRPLVEQGVVSQSEGTILEMTVRASEAPLLSSQARLRLLEAGYRKEEVEMARATVAMNQ